MIMKKIYFVVIISLLFLGCKSNENKALSLINKDMFKSLYDYSSYEPVETIVTEAFSSIYTDSLIRAQAIRAEALCELYNEAFKKGKDAGEYAEIYADSYYSSGRRKYLEYLNEAKTEFEKAKSYATLWQAAEDSIKTLASQFSPTRIGWEVKHKFRCKNRGGNYSLGDYIYIIDNKFSKIISKYDMDDDDESDIRERIDVVIKPSEED